MYGLQDGTFADLMSAFDLASNDKFDSQATKISKMHVVCGLSKDQTLDKMWFQCQSSGSKMHKKIKCTKN